MNGWILTYFAINFVGLGILAATHGEPTTVNFWSGIFGLCISLTLLYMGGAFS